MAASPDVTAEIKELQADRFTDFERGVLQDNIALCDAKAGLLLAFTGAMVIFCIDAIVTVHAQPGPHVRLLDAAIRVLLVGAAAGFLASSQFSLTTVLPRIVLGTADHIFWESPVFRLPVEDYVAAVRAMDPTTQSTEMLRHLHLLSGICRSKFRHLRLALRLAQGAFLLLVVGELARLVR